MAIVDTQHQQLVAMLNLHFAQKKGIDLLSMFQMLGDFHAYAMLHFDTEEHLIVEAHMAECHRRDKYR